MPIRFHPHVTSLLPLLILAVVVLYRSPAVRAKMAPLRERFAPKASVRERLGQYGPAARERWAPFFEAAGIPYPPGHLVLAGLKREMRLEVYASAENGGALRFIRAYPVLGASGGPGPKLREGDRQVPEGLYRIESLNPNSRFHLSLRINYPNEEDLALAREKGRDHPGSDIMIHGNRLSVGCLAMGDPAAEDLFILAADTGVTNIEVLLAPHDFRLDPASPTLPDPPPWLEARYNDLRAALSRLPEPED